MKNIIKTSYFILPAFVAQGCTLNNTVPLVNAPVSAIQPASRPSSKTLLQTYSGSYYRGDGLGYNVTLDLRPDGTYDGLWRGCEGVYGTAKGKWLVKGNHVNLMPTEEKDMMKGHVRTLDIIRYKKKIFLLRASDRASAPKTPRDGRDFYYFIKSKLRTPPATKTNRI